MKQNNAKTRVVVLVVALALATNPHGATLAAGQCADMYNWREEDTFFDDYYHTTVDEAPEDWGDPPIDMPPEWYQEAQSSFEVANPHSAWVEDWMANHYNGETYLHPYCVAR